MTRGLKYPVDELASPFSCRSDCPRSVSGHFGPLAGPPGRDPSEGQAIRLLGFGFLDVYPRMISRKVKICVTNCLSV